MLNTTDKIQLWYSKLFNYHAIKDGTPPFQHYANSFDRSDYGVAIRIEEGLAHQTENIELFIIVITAILAILIIGFGIAILVNQRKIKKQLKKLLEEKEDKPV